MKTSSYPEIEYWSRLIRESDGGVIDIDDFDDYTKDIGLFNREVGNPRKDHGDVLVSVVDSTSMGYNMYKILGLFNPKSDPTAEQKCNDLIVKYSNSKHIDHLILFKFDEKKRKYTGQSVWNRRYEIDPRDMDCYEDDIFCEPETIDEGVHKVDQKFIEIDSRSIENKVKELPHTIFKWFIESLYTYLESAEENDGIPKLLKDMFKGVRCNNRIITIDSFGYGRELISTKHLIFIKGSFKVTVQISDHERDSYRISDFFDSIRDLYINWPDNVLRCTEFNPNMFKYSYLNKWPLIYLNKEHSIHLLTNRCIIDIIPKNTACVYFADDENEGRIGDRFK